MKKCKVLSLLLTAAVLTTSIVPNNVYAAAVEEQGQLVQATELESTSRLDEASVSANEKLDVALYDDDELVTVIVELEEAPVLDYYNAEEAVATMAEEELSSGEAVAEYLASDLASEVSEELESEQQEVFEEVSRIDADNDTELLAQWTNVANAMAVKVTYGSLKEIKNIDGVKKAYVQHVFDRPEEAASTDLSAANYTYSLDMIGTNEAWANGYTGKGMLVAVMDTGIDVIQNRYNGSYIGSHEVFTEDSFKSGNPTDGQNDWELRYTEDTMTEFLANTALWANTSAVDETTHITYDNNALYKNVKVPYGFDYADWDVQTRPASNNHGVHVAGTVAGYAESEDGEVLFSGVAPDAQILAMKVFPDADGGAEELSLVCALEDAMKLGADVVNLSLGSDNGYADDDTMQNEVYARVEAAGIIMMTSAGNSDDSTDGNNYGDANLTSNPEISMMSSPAIFKSNLSVASIDNTVNVKSYLKYTIDGTTTEAFFNDANGSFASAFADKEYPIYLVDGVGTYNDFYNANFNTGYNGGKTGIALVKRGEIAFTEKLTNASYFHGTNYRGEEYGVLGVIVYDADPESEDLITMSVDGTTVKSCFISGKQGAELAQALRDGKSVSIKSSEVDKLIENATAGQMSSFTSWGAGSALELKPEITAPGGNVWSAVMDKAAAETADYVGTYQMMSGTSMAAPHMTGAAALVRQRVTTSGEFGALTNAEVGDVTSQLLVSTAIPQKDENGVYYSPRQQGAGLVNVGAATSSKAYISVEGQNVGKLELGDDVEKTGTYSFDFDIHNVSGSSITYNMKVVLMRPDTFEDEASKLVEIGDESTLVEWGNRTLMANNDVVILEEDLGTVTAKGNRVTSVSESVSLSKAVKAELDSLFENGIYVEGYVILEAVDNTNPTLGLPVLAFYGDWTKAPIFDASTWTDEVEDIYMQECTWNTNIFGSTLRDASNNTLGYYNLGQNVFSAVDTDQRVFHDSNIALSPNGDGYFDQIDDILLYQVRNARVIIFEVKDVETGEVYYRKAAPRCAKTTYDSTNGYALPYTLYYEDYIVWDGTDAEGNVLPDGTRVSFTAYAYTDGEYEVLGTTYDDYYQMDVTNFDAIIPGQVEPTFNGHAMDMTGDVVSCNVLIDTVAPKLTNSSVSIYEKDGRTYLKGQVYDETGSLANIEVAPLVKRTHKYYPEYEPSYAADRNNCFYSNTIYDANTKTVTFECDVTEYAHTKETYQGENYSYDFTWEGVVYISCGDYAANDRTYAVKVDATTGLVLSQTSAKLQEGQSFELSVNNNTGKDLPIVRTSSNPDVATIDEYGNVKALSKGQTVITVSNGEDSAICVVAVVEKVTEVQDFNLSIDRVDGLKTDGQATVKVTNLYPADVELSEIRWEVSEDEDYANDYAAGLITVEKASDDGLSGSLYLNVAYSEELIPAGHATLTVTLNGVSRSMDVNWDDVYTSYNQDGLISNELYQEQVLYVTQGQSAEFTAKYRNASAHEYGEVLTDLTGLVLDGAEFFSKGGSYTAKLVPEKGYKLPENIVIYNRYIYSGGYYDSPRYEGTDYGYRYNKETGEISIVYAPTGTVQLLVVAAGVEDETNTAEPVLSDNSFEIPDGIYGPFDWTVKEGNGSLETFEYENNYGEKYMKVRYTPAEPGVSYIVATSKNSLDANGNPYELEFAVVSEGVKADKLVVADHNLFVEEKATVTATATLSPVPTLASDEELIWTSHNKEVATVDQNGVITGVKAGYAYIEVASRANTNVTNYFIVQVLPGQEEEPEVTPGDKPEVTPGETPDTDKKDDVNDDQNNDKNDDVNDDQNNDKKDDANDDQNNNNNNKDDVIKGDEDEVLGINNKPTTLAPAENPVKTGDQAPLGLYGILLGLGVVCFFLGGKKKHED